METFEYMGVWWLPENPDNQKSGILKYNPKEGASLELIGTFKSNDDIRAIDNKVLSSPNIILGVTVNGKPITLYKCQEIKFILNLFGLPKSTFSVKAIFIGNHFKNEEEIIFDFISVSYSNLEDWVGISGISQRNEFDKSGHLKKITWNYEFPMEIKTKIDNFDISTYFSLNHGLHRYSINLNQTTFIKIKPHDPIGFKEYHHGIMQNIRDFLSLAMGKAIYPRIIIGKPKASLQQSANGEIILNDIQIFIQLGKFSDFSNKINPFEMLFTFNDLAENFGTYLKNWIDKSSSLGPVYELYFGTLYNASMYPIHEFLSLALALEAYHRRIFGGKYVSDEYFKPQYEAILKAIRNDIPDDFKESLRMKSKYLNEYSLRKRLKDILESLGDCIDIVIKSADSFVNDICNTRNYLTHYDDRLKPLAKNGQDLYWLIQKMKFVIEICFLSELGFSVENIKALIAKTQKYRDLQDH
jgi:hypothetical protein